MSSLTGLFGGGRRRLLASAAAALLVAAVVLVFLGFSAQHHPPQPPASAGLPVAATPAPVTTTAPSAVPAMPAVPAPPASSSAAAPAQPAITPVALSIPAIGVHHTLIQLGLNTDGTLQVPPLSDPGIPGWYRNSPTPGQVGPAVIVGHIDGNTGAEGVFYNLGALRPGDTVQVTRSDHTVATFRIDGVDKYAKASFPTVTVYGNTADPQLRLITCAGPFENQHYQDDIVVYATLTGTGPA
jgi:sortase (surface protein transpeptidase)